MDFIKIESILDKAWAEGRTSLSEPEVYKVLDAAGLKTAARRTFGKPLDLKQTAAEIHNSIPGGKVVIKLVSSKTLHKTESGGVKIAENTAGDILETLKAMDAKFEDAEGFMAVEFVEHCPFGLGEELLLGARADDAFGPVITLGPGGTHAEFFTKSLKTGITPSVITAENADAEAWDKFLESNWIWKYSSGKVRGGKRKAEDAEIMKWLKGFAALMLHFKDNGKSRYSIIEFEINPLTIAGGNITALDGVLRFRESKKALRDKPSEEGVGALLAPKSVAMLGVSEKKVNMARVILRNVINIGFSKEHIYIVKPGTGEIDGIKCVNSPAELPEQIDMYVISVPAPAVIDAVKEAGDSGKINGVVLISGGIGEKSGTGDISKKLTDTIVEARKNNPKFALSGGNSMGIVLNDSRVNTFFIPVYKLAHPTGVNPHMVRTAFVSQSGAFVISSESRMPWLKPAYSITVGNQHDITVVDYMNKLCEDPELKVIMAYIEGFKPGDGLNLIKTIKKARKLGKKVVLYKAGRTAVGQKAVMGHTASIAGNYLVSSLLLKQAGALVADNFNDFNDYSMLACYFGKYDSINPNTFFLSNAGFECAGMADRITGNLRAGFPEDDKLKTEMNEVLKAGRLDGLVDVKNPFDVTPSAADKYIAAITEKALNHSYFGGAVLSMVPLSPSVNTLPAGKGHNEDFTKDSFVTSSVEAARKAGKPVIFVVAAGEWYDPYCKYAMEQGLPTFRSADRAVRVYSDYVEYINAEI